MDNPLASKEMQKKRYDAAVDFLKAFQERMPLVNGKPHPGTVFAVVSRLAGTNLFRAVNGDKEFTAGTVILSEEINQAYPQLLNLFALYCKQNGVDVMSKPPVATFPEKDKPLMTVEQVLQEYQDQYHAIMKKHGLDYLESARAGMVVCSIIFTYHCVRSKDIDPNVATGIVAMGVVEGAKTAPPPLESKSSSKSGQNIKNVGRLLLGELDDVVRESLAHGGIFIDPGPEAIAALKQANIDPYLVYEQGLRNEINAKISRIDFVKVDVDKLFEEWRFKDYSRAPIHVRLLIWLKNNAITYGYIQERNSWVLK
jgi:hypothetical protein